MAKDDKGDPDPQETFDSEAPNDDGPSSASNEANAEMTVPEILEQLSQTLDREYQDLGHTLPSTSLKPVTGRSSGQTIRGESFSSSGSVRQRSIQSAEAATESEAGWETGDSSLD